MSDNTSTSERILTPTEYFNKRNDKTVGEMFDEQLLLNPKWCIKMMQDYGAHIRGKLQANDSGKGSASEVRVNARVSAHEAPNDIDNNGIPLAKRLVSKSKELKHNLNCGDLVKAKGVLKSCADSVEKLDKEIAKLHLSNKPEGSKGA